MCVEAGRHEQQVGTELPEHRQDDLGEHELVVLVDGARLERQVHRSAFAGPVPTSHAAPVPG